MRWPWVDLLFLHGYIATPAAALAWRADVPPCGCNDAKKGAADIAQLPLDAEQHEDSTCCA